MSARPASPARVIGLVLLPLILSAIAAVALAITIQSTQVYAQGSPAALALVVGGAASGVVLVMVLVARAARRRVLDNVEETAEEAVRSDRRTFLMRLDHELKNPITALRVAAANVSALIDEADPAIADSLASIDAQAMRLSRLTADLRKVAEIETQTLAVTAVEIPQLLDEVKSAVEQTSGRRIDLLVPRAPAPMNAAVGDEDLLFLAVHNLVANAAKFCAPTDTIELRGFEDAPWVVIEVADTGPGIPAEETRLVWQELGRGRNARGFPGSGLGLALVRTIVGRHGGLVEMHSEEGRGALFAIRLHPAASTQTQRLDLTGAT